MSLPNESAPCDSGVELAGFSAFWARNTHQRLPSGKNVLLCLYQYWYDFAWIKAVSSPTIATRGGRLVVICRACRRSVAAARAAWRAPDLRLDVYGKSGSLSDGSVYVYKQHNSSARRLDQPEYIPRIRLCRFGHHRFPEIPKGKHTY